jgi:amino-acid N-acetyltransferase
MEKITYAYAESENLTAIEQLLEECELPYQDVVNHLSHFFIAKKDGKLIGVIGLEIMSTMGLIRSLAVSPSFRGKGIAIELYIRILAYAHLIKGIKKLYLLTLTAEGFFTKLGFEKIDRNNVPDAIQSTEEFRSLCPATAVCMVKKIENEPHYYPREILRLNPDVAGAAMWAVALKNTMFTYFEIAPNSRFELHHHESEQITMVLEGKLFFESGNQVISVGKGEVIALPSNIPHAAHTTDEAVKAVDAWSPVREKYRK